HENDVELEGPTCRLKHKRNPWVSRPLDVSVDETERQEWQQLRGCVNSRSSTTCEGESYSRTILNAAGPRVQIQVPVEGTLPALRATWCCPRSTTTSSTR
ncbi:unnamed protein product, partial [Ectocarpus sp. 12 AP-2014]